MKTTQHIAAKQLFEKGFTVNEMRSFLARHVCNQTGLVSVRAINIQKGKNKRK